MAHTTYSMTGYGKHTATYNGRLLTVEIRTLNGKQADLNVRMPSIYRDREYEIRDLISTELSRGKIDVNIQRDLAPGESTAVLNESLFPTYYRILKRLEKDMEEKPAQHTTDYLSLIMKMPDTLKQAADDLDTREAEIMMDTIRQCIQNVNAFRSQEGAKLDAILVDSIHRIQKLLGDIAPLEDDRLARIRGKLSNNLNDETEGSNVDMDRFEQELIYYLEKLDITEEKVRLKAHCDYFLKTLVEELVKGRKLNFISQEIGREINTLGSKAQHAEIQRIVVNMKDELEKIKEQLLNIL